MTMFPYDRAVFRLPLLLAALFAATPAAAAPELPEGRYNVMSGTGFIVSSNGHIITNHHVVNGCKTVRLQGALPGETAEVTAVDEEHDLALLKTRARIRHVATIRHPGASKLRLDERILVMGYPLDSYVKDQYKVVPSKIIGLQGPEDEPHWIQFADAAQQGNSGGPLLDSSGNVAGVVVGKSELFTLYGRNGQPEVVSRSDIAISLPVLMRFLEKHYVAYRFNGSFSYVMEARIEDMAKGYIVNVLCIRPAGEGAS